MPSNYDAIDLVWTWNGDFKVGVDGDLADTQGDQIQSTIQEIRAILRAELGDWDEHPTYAADIVDFVGEPNTAETARLIQERIKSALVKNSILNPEDLQIRIVPVGPHTLFLSLHLDAVATSNNSVDSLGSTLSVVLDTNEKLIYFIEGQDAV